LSEGSSQSSLLIIVSKQYYQYCTKKQIVFIFVCKMLIS